jgi:hypothetical protein
MIGTLLEDIVSGLPFDTIKSRFDEKMGPLQYQRPQALPSEGAIRRAEEIVEKLGIKDSLPRRFAKLSDIQAFWTPKVGHAVEPQGAGVFSHLQAKDQVKPGAIEQPATTMTWEKFAKTVLPEALEIECFAPQVGNYFAFVTAQNPDAPPILQWDTPEKRNPVSCYVYHGGSYATRWGLPAGYYVPVTAIAHGPHQWNDPEGTKFAHQGKRIFFILKGAKDTQYTHSGLFFPECLKNELREVRSVLESYANTGVISGKDEAEACGLTVTANAGRGSNENWGLTLRVRTQHEWLTIKLDRWD